MSHSNALKFVIIKAIFLVFSIIWIQFDLKSQTEVVKHDSIYQSNIKKTRLYGVYIPKDIPDVMKELDRLSTPEAKTNLQKADEQTIGKKLRFGLGRWMEYNWNLQEGSRISHLLREMGLWNSDDMVEFLIVLYFRHVNNKPLEAESLAKSLAEQRAKWMKLQQDKNTIDTIDKKE